MRIVVNFNAVQMFARRRDLLRQKEQVTTKKNPDDDVELSDSEIEEIFEVRPKGSKGPAKSRAVKQKRDKVKPADKQLVAAANQQTKSESDVIIMLDSDEDDGMVVSGRRTLPPLNNVRTANDNSQPINDYDSDDEILICSTHNSPNRASTSLIEPSFDEDQFDPSKFNFARQTNIKFRYQGSYKCIQFYSTDKFKEKFDELREVLGIDPSKMVLMFEGKTISFEESPGSLNIGIVDIIDVFDKKDEEQLIEEAEDPNLFKLKFRDCDSRKKNQDVALTMNRYDTFECVFRKYAEKKELNLNEIIFEFDGEKVSADDKPDDLDMESDSVIEVKLKRT